MKRALTSEQEKARDERRARMQKIAADIRALSDEQRAELASNMMCATIEGHGLSIHNTCMLAMQNPTATMHKKTCRLPSSSSLQPPASASRDQSSKTIAILPISPGSSMAHVSPSSSTFLACNCSTTSKRRLMESCCCAPTNSRCLIPAPRRGNDRLWRSSLLGRDWVKPFSFGTASRTALCRQREAIQTLPLTTTMKSNCSGIYAASISMSVTSGCFQARD